MEEKTLDETLKEPPAKPKIVEAETVKDDEADFLDRIVEKGSADGKLSRQSIRYLRNDGDPKRELIDIQRHWHWMDEKGKKRVIEIIMRRDESDAREKRLADQLRLTVGEKAVLYFQPDGSIVKKVLDENQTFTVENWPHILGVVYGDGEGELSKRRRYRILVGEIVKITNEKDYNKLWKTFGFLNEVDEDGKIIRENVFEEEKKNPSQKTKKPYPNTFGEASDADFKKSMASPEEKRNELKEASEDDEFDSEADEAENPSKEI